MASTIGKKDLFDSVAEETGVSKKDVANVLNTALDQIGEHLQRGDKVTITGFGSFDVRQRKARTGVKPGTSEKIQIPASKYPAFKPGKSLKDKVTN